VALRIELLQRGWIDDNSLVSLLVDYDLLEDLLVGLETGEELDLLDHVQGRVRSDWVVELSRSLALLCASELLVEVPLARCL